MLIGAAIKNYKVYKNLQYIPISSGFEFSAFLGPNGIGKTSIFEALDKFFNGGEWVINNESKKITDASAFIAPLFLIPIDLINLSKKEKRIASILSNYFWNYSDLSYNQFIEHFKNDVSALSRKGLGANSHYLIMLGQTHQTNEIHIPHFEKK